MFRYTCIAFLALAVSGCVGKVDGRKSNDPPTDDALIGAGGRDITQFWPSIDLPYSDNAKALTFDQLRNEVERATGHSWVVDGQDQWEANRSVLGGADFVNTFDDDRTISQQKIVAIRKMAFTVCGDMTAAEDESPTIFTIVRPSAPIGTDATRDQVAALYRQFFLVAPSAAEVDESVDLLTDLESQAGSSEAWRGLCGAYLTSMRFLTY